MENTEGFAVHVGLKPEHIDEFRKDYASYASGRKSYVDGDGWNCWGDKPGTDVNDEDTLAVTIQTRTLGQAIDLAQEIADNCVLLVPSDPSKHGGGSLYGKDGVLVVVSEMADWSHQYYVVNSDGEFTYSNSVTR